MKRSLVATISLFALAGCSIMQSEDKPLGIKGNFKVQMRTNAKYFKDAKQYPVSGFLPDNVPFMNQSIIPAGSGILGIYKNSGFTCSIIWTTIVLPNGQTLSNAKGVALSDCYTGATINAADTINAYWN